MSSATVEAASALPSAVASSSLSWASLIAYLRCGHFAWMPSKLFARAPEKNSARARLSFSWYS
jgi:hypothetical protein